MASIRIGSASAHSGYRFCTQRLMLISCARCLMLVSQARDVRRGSRIRRAGEGGARRWSRSAPCRRRIRAARRVRVLALRRGRYAVAVELRDGRNGLVGDWGALPHQSRASGILSNGDKISWGNYFSDISCLIVQHGNHATVPPVLRESTVWLRECAETADFVGREIGHMAYAALSSEMTSRRPQTCPRGCSRGGCSYSFVNLSH